MFYIKLMLANRYFLCWFWLIVSLPLSISAKPLNLVLPNFPPYSYSQNQQVKGIAVELVQPVLDKMGIEYQLTLVKDYGLAVNLVKTGMADGFFLASQNSRRDKIAQFSTPVMINRWCWYMLPNNKLNPKDKLNFRFNAEIGTIGKTNTERWLIKQGYPIKAAPVSSKALARLLLDRKINTAFVAEKVFDQALGFERHNVTKIVAIEKPFGIYISHDYLRQHPDFMLKLNQAIQSQSQATLKNSQ